MGLLDKFRDNKKKNNAVDFARKTLNNNYDDEFLEKIEYLEEQFRILDNLGAFDEESRSLFDEKMHSIKDGMQNNENKYKLLSDIDLASFYLKEVRQKYELLQVNVEQVYDELVHYGNVLPCNTSFFKKVFELCYDKIKNDTSILKESKEEFLKILSTELSASNVSDRSIPDYIKRKQVDSMISIYCNPAEEFYSRIIKGDLEIINSCNENYYIRYALWKMENEVYLDSGKKQDILDRLVLKKDELRNNEYGVSKKR